MKKLLYIPEEAIEKPVEEPKVDWEHFTPDFVGTQVQTLDLSMLEEQIRLAQQLYRDGRLGQTGGEVNFQANHPVCIFFLGDVHYGSVFTDHERFHREVQKIADTPGCYIVWMSNLIDNAIPSQYPSNMLNNIMPPDKQVVAMRKLMVELNAKNKVLGAVTSPCHEGWTWKHTGQDVNALIFGFPERRFPVMDNGSKLMVQVGEQHYCLALYHQVGPFESNFNETHALRQMNRLNLLMEGDVVVGAHRHYAAAQLVYEGVGESIKPVAYLRTGTYKGIGKDPDQFSVGRYGATGEPSAQSVILWHDRHGISVSLEFELGLELYKSL